MNLLEFCVRKDMEDSVPRGMGVLQPLKVVLTNFPEDQNIELQGPWHAQSESLGQRSLPFGRELYIERSDFELEPPKKYKRLSPGEMVRLRYAFIIRCDEVIFDDNGDVVQLNCSYFEDSRSGQDTSGLKPKGVIHWVDAPPVCQCKYATISVCLKCRIPVVTRCWTILIRIRSHT